jgi:hypothetical protein
MIRIFEEKRLSAGLSGRHDLAGRPFRPGRHVPVDQFPAITRVGQDGFALGHDRPDRPGPRGGLFLALDVFGSEGAAPAMASHVLTFFPVYPSGLPGSPLLDGKECARRVGEPAVRPEGSWRSVLGKT